VHTWTGADLPALVSVVDAAFPGEDLSADEVQSACFEDPAPSIVLGLPDGEGAVAVTARPSEMGPIASLLLLAVAPAARGEGRGRRLLEAAEEWAFDEAGAIRVGAAGSAPFSLWPGVDVHWTPALCLFDSAGYRDDGAAVLLSFPSSYRAAPPPGVELRRVVSDEEAKMAARFCAEQWPAWGAEVGRAVEHGCCLVALAPAAPGTPAAPAAPAGDGTMPVGLVCHSVSRTGWIGPIGVVEGHRGLGIGSALLAAVSTDLMVAGIREAHVWPGDPMGFFARRAGASTSRVFLRRSRSRT
jgi:GNAT superfamily N-acetyltransferase